MIMQSKYKEDIYIIKRHPNGNSYALYTHDHKLIPNQVSLIVEYGMNDNNTAEVSFYGEFQQIIGFDEHANYLKIGGNKYYGLLELGCESSKESPNLLTNKVPIKA